MKSSKKNIILLIICTVIITGCINSGASPDNNTPPASSNINTNIRIVPSKHYAYVTSHIESLITVCHVNEDNNGGLNECGKIDAELQGHPQGLAIAPSHKSLYISTSNSVIYKCSINDSNGDLFNCYAYGNRAVINSPTFMAVDSTGNNLYISDKVNNSIAVCKINSDESLSNCEVAGSMFSGPRGITLSPNGKFAYVSNKYSKQVSICTIKDGDRVFTSCVPYGHHSSFTKLSGIVASKSGEYVYISDSGSDAFAKTCTVIENGKSFSRCNNYRLEGVNGAKDIAIDSTDTHIYLTIPHKNLVYKFKIIGGVYVLSVSFTGHGNFKVPDAIAIF